jgi:hypothetical protein
MDRLATELRVDSWKGYAVGDLLAESLYPWRMDDEKIAYPAYEKARKYGIKNVSVHKGLLPAIDPRRCAPGGTRWWTMSVAPRRTGRT